MNLDQMMLAGDFPTVSEVYAHKNRKILQGIVCAFLNHDYGFRETEHAVYPEKRRIVIACRRCEQKIILSLAPKAKFGGLEELVTTGERMTRAIHYPNDAQGEDK